MRALVMINFVFLFLLRTKRSLQTLPFLPLGGFQKAEDLRRVEWHPVHARWSDASAFCSGLASASQGCHQAWKANGSCVSCRWRGRGQGNGGEDASTTTASTTVPLGTPSEPVAPGGGAAGSQGTTTPEQVASLQATGAGSEQQPIMLGDESSSPGPKATWPTGLRQLEEEHRMKEGEEQASSTTDRPVGDVEMQEAGQVPEPQPSRVSTPPRDMEVDTNAEEWVEEEEAQATVQVGVLEEHPTTIQEEGAKEPEEKQAGSSVATGFEERLELVMQRVEESAAAGTEEREGSGAQQAEECPPQAEQPAAESSGVVRELRIVPYQAPLWAGNLVPHLVPGSATGEAVYEEVAGADI